MTTLFVYLQTRFIELRDREDGAVAVEYGLILLFIAVALVVAMTALRGQIATAYGRIGAALGNP